jgi:hypothetical protein
MEDRAALIFERIRQRDGWLGARPDRWRLSAARFLKAAVAYYASLGVAVTRVMTDPAVAIRPSRFATPAREFGLRHIRTRPYTRKTTGKAERFIHSALREWAYAQAYPWSDRRADELRTWLHRYNWRRPHAGIKSKTPISTLGLSVDNLLRRHKLGQGRNIRRGWRASVRRRRAIAGR